MGWNIIWNESQFGMSKNYSHFLWIWRVLHIFPTSCYGSGCELPKCLNYFHAKLLQDWTLTFLFVQSSHSEFCCFLHESSKRETMRMVDSELCQPHTYFSLKEITQLLSSKTWCLILIVGWGKIKKLFTNGDKLLPLVKLLFLPKFRVWFTLQLEEKWCTNLSTKIIYCHWSSYPEFFF